MNPMVFLAQNSGKQGGKRKLVEVPAITSEFGATPAPYSNDANAANVNDKKRKYNKSEVSNQGQHSRDDKRL